MDINIEIEGNVYQIEITRKRIKNMYLKIKAGPIIEVSAPLYATDKQITKFIESNIKFIYKNVVKKQKISDAKQGKFEFLGHYYDIVYTKHRSIELNDTTAFVGESININSWYKKQALDIFTEYYNDCFDNFKEYSIKPDLKVRKMKGKWGICNITNGTITLNQELIKLEPRCIEYVIYHELSHLVHHNHSKNFWMLVEKYVPEYKEIRKSMRNV